jgi:hypothetical protein
LELESIIPTVVIDLFSGFQRLSLQPPFQVWPPQISQHAAVRFLTNRNQVEMAGNESRMILNEFRMNPNEI